MTWYSSCHKNCIYCRSTVKEILMHPNCPYHLLHIKPALSPLIAEWRAVWHLELSFLSVAAWRRDWSASTSSFLTVLGIKISEMTIMLHSIRLETINSLVKFLLGLEIKETKLIFSHRLQYSHTSFYNQRSCPLLTVKKNAGSRHLYVSIRYIYVSLAKACCWSGVGEMRFGILPKYSSDGGLSMSYSIFLVRRSSSSSGWAMGALPWKQRKEHTVAVTRRETSKR